MKNMVKPYVSIHIYEFIYEFMLLNSWWWNNIWNQIVNSCLNSVLSSLQWRILWNYGWILTNEFTHAIMLEFIDLKLIQIQLRIGLIQSFFAVSPLPALRLLRWCCWVVTGRRCCDGRLRMLHTAEHGGRGVPWWTSLASRSAGPDCQQ